MKTFIGIAQNVKHHVLKKSGLDSASGNFGIPKTTTM